MTISKVQGLFVLCHYPFNKNSSLSVYNILYLFHGCLYNAFNNLARSLDGHKLSVVRDGATWHGQRGCLHPHSQRGGLKPVESIMRPPGASILKQPGLGGGPTNKTCHWNWN